jgi:hypothetical protein
MNGEFERPKAGVSEKEGAKDVPERLAADEPCMAVQATRRA